ncbi:MAG: class I SAM-dependent methyltransferase [Gammaproteobacteria bacterium]|nr:class I SAM-dependent methyltransferase [Gammaproteobacteria bacterium]
MTDSTQRFSNRVEDYIRYRPGYPAELVPRLLEETGLGASAAVADVGSGTGIFTRLLLQQDLRVYAIEPNAPMREAAEATLGDSPHFTSVVAPAEDTGLASDSLDLVTAAQAFHWFNNDAAKAEFRRILKPAGRLALVWNRRRLSQPFQHAYDAILRELSPEYGKVNHMNLDDTEIAGFFAAGEMQVLHFNYSQQFDFPGLLGRLKSSSYCPAEDSRHYIPLVTELLALFDQHALEGSIEFEYDTQLYFGPM